MKVSAILSLIICLGLAACATLPPAYEPQTPDEQAIVQMLQKMASGYNTGNVEKQIAPYTSDAIIETLLLDGQAVSRDQYAEVLRAQVQRSVIEIRPITVKVLSEDRAEAVAIISRAPSHGGDFLGERKYRLARREGQWRIVEARYIR